MKQPEANPLKERLSATVRAIDELISKKHLSDEELKDISGIYWRIVKEEIKQHGEAISYTTSISLRFPEPLLIFKQECLELIWEIERKEYERNLDEKYKLANIRYAKRAYIISIISIIIAIASLLIKI